LHDFIGRCEGETLDGIRERNKIKSECRERKRKWKRRQKDRHDAERENESCAGVRKITKRQA